MRHFHRQHNSGVTLIELLIVLSMMVILTVAVGYVFTAGLDIQRLNMARQGQTNKSAAFEKRITQMLKGAKLSDSTTDTTTFFLGTSTGSGNNGDIGSDQLIFTTSALPIPSSLMVNEDDFETQQNNFGPTGGVSEVEYNMTPVGDAGNKTGLFERVQTPSDGDSTQGGMESLLTENVDQIGFQFWDGAEWQQTWDTTTTRRLPAAVLVSYLPKGSTDNQMRTFTVSIPTSDVDSQNPVQNTVTQ